MEIVKAQESGFDKMIDIWEASVRATHDFLTENDIKSLRKLIREKYFHIKELSIEIIKKENEILGFVGTAEDTIEMLFIDPKYFGKQVGAKLLEHALVDKNCTKVDVNEQNPRATRFYQKNGFTIKSHSETDNQGNPFPILHLELSNVD